MSELKAIPTVYRGIEFRSRLEAQWAVFFDACGVDWEYEPEGFELPDGTRYLPDFLLHEVNGWGNLWAEVKGELTSKDLHKIEEFSTTGEGGEKPNPYAFPNPIILLGRIPRGNDFWDIWFDSYSEDGNYYFLSFRYIYGNVSLAFPCLDLNGKFTLAEEDGWKEIDQNLTYAAYCSALSAKFEFDQSPLPISLTSCREKLKKLEKLEKLMSDLKDALDVF